MLGRHDEAEPLAQLGRQLGAREDVDAQVTWRQAQALVHAHRGEHEQAEQLAREAVALAERTDAPNFHGRALWDLAEVLAANSRTEEAVRTLEQSLERFEAKRNLAQAGRVRARLEERTLACREEFDPRG
jgi:tetratricopeptide (TPR) repeat protein